MSSAPCPNEGRALEGARTRGQPEEAVAEMRHRSLRDQAGDTRRVGAVAVKGATQRLVTAAQAVWSRCAGRASRDMAAGVLLRHNAGTQVNSQSGG